MFVRVIVVMQVLFCWIKNKIRFVGTVEIIATVPDGDE